ncbi:hypothetical protein D1007_12654 [Hordeum vulgare]|nr:hypothetical protein D1007_12654 [Hordeum vulgare]
MVPKLLRRHCEPERREAILAHLPRLREPAPRRDEELVAVELLCRRRVEAQRPVDLRGTTGAETAAAGGLSLMAGVVRLWNDWEVEILVLVSFMLQVFLLMFARMRRRNISIVPRTLLWLAYLLADSIAIYTLGHMSFCGKSHGHQQLTAFWAPFLLVHLGGQDNITAYSIEDNQLWPRHLLSFVVQTVGVAYVLYKYVAGSWALVTAAALIFVSGVLKYGERVWALKLSSLENISKFLDSKKLIEVKREQDAPRDQRKNLDPEAIQQHVEWGQGVNLDVEEVLQGAHDLLPICMAQFVDYKFWPSPFQSKVVEIFDNKGQMFELVEMQLSLMYDFLYTKAAVVFTWYGCFIRAISSAATITTFFLFQSSIGKNDFKRVDAIVTYILIVGAVFLEMTALLKAMGSTWTCALLHARRCHWLHSVVIYVRRCVKAAERNRRWSGSIGQPELLNLPHGSGGCKPTLRCKDLWKKLHHHTLPVISDGTKKLVLDEVRRMVEACDGKEDIMRSYNGQCALNPWSGLFKDPTSHAGINFDERILSWYFATKIFFSWSSHVEQHGYVEAITAVSNYMTFLVAARPYMLPSPVRPGLYASTEAAYVGLDFSDRDIISKQLGVDRRRRMWELDERTDVDELYRVRGKLGIVSEDLDIIRKDLETRWNEAVKSNRAIPLRGNAREEMRKTKKELERRLEELNTRREELDDLTIEVGGRREKLEVLNKRRVELDRRLEELNDLTLQVGDRREELEVLNKGRKDLYQRLEELNDLTLEVSSRREKLEVRNRRRKELDRRSEVDGIFEGNLELNQEELHTIMNRLEELDRRSEGLRFGPPPPPALVHGAEIAVRLLEVEARGEQEVSRVLFGVWVEMLCYAAHHCTRDSHASQLNSGGEFITVVWLLSTTVFNHRYCDEPWFKKGVWEFLRRRFHYKQKKRKEYGWFHRFLVSCGFPPDLWYWPQAGRNGRRRSEYSYWFAEEGTSPVAGKWHLSYKEEHKKYDTKGMAIQL